MELTKKEAYSKHREVWDWFYHHPPKEKYEWPDWEKYPFYMFCFLCVVHNNDCNKCPLGEKSGLYWKWNDAKSSKTRKKYAALIRDIVNET